MIGIQALGAYAEKAFSASSRIEMKIKQGDLSYTASINPQNAITLQSFKVILGIILISELIVKLFFLFSS